MAASSSSSTPGRRYALVRVNQVVNEINPDQQAEADREVFARAALIRRLPSVQGLGRSSKAAAHASHSPLRRPATASAAVHSRVHQALQRSGSEFSLAVKKSLTATHEVPGRKDDDPPKTSEAAVPAKRRPSVLDARRNPGSIIDHSTQIVARKTTTSGVDHTSHNQRSDSHSPGHNSALSSPGDRHKSNGNRQSPHPNEQFDGLQLKQADRSSTSGVAIDEQVHIQRKRRCAKAFADMLLSRMNLSDARGGGEIDPNNSTALSEDFVDTDDKGIGTLLEHGIIQSILNLMSSSSDAVTLTHCCRALYILSADASARKLMVAQGVVTSIKPLARVAPPESREDLAAMLCRLAEEPGATETLFFEGIDRTLTRLHSSSGPETKRICSVAAFNLSVGAKQLKHFGDSLSQLLASLSKQKIGAQADAATTLPSVEHLLKAIYNVSLLPAYHTALLNESIPRFMILQIPLVPPSIQVWALRSFVLLCGSRVNRVQLLSQQFCKLLKAALTCPDDTTQELAIIILLLLSLDEGSRIKLCTWVPAAAIIQSGQRLLLNQAVNTDETPETDVSSDRVLRHRLLHFHAYLLRNLCESVLTHHELIAEGAIPVLLAMSRANDVTLKSCAISALCPIISSSADEIVQDIPEITEQLLTLATEEEQCEFAVTALYNITCCDDALELIGGSPSLLQTVLRVASSPPKPTLADLVSSIVYRLATVPQCAPLLLEHGYLPVLILLIHRFPSCRTFALNALFLMAQFGGNQFPHGGEEIAQLVVALLSDGQETSMGLTRKGEVVTDPIMLRSAVTLLAYLASHSKNRAMLVRSGSIFRFLKRMHRVSDDDGIVLTNCAFVLYCLTATQEGSDQLAKERGIEDIIHLARTRSPNSSAEPSFSTQSTKMPPASDLYAVQELCMQALCRLSTYLGLENRLIEQGAIQGAMVLALVKTDRTSIKSLCVKILANCLVAKSCLRSLIDNGVIWALSSLCLVAYPAHEMDTYAACAICLCNLSSVGTMVPKFLDAGAPRALTHLLNQGLSGPTVLVVIKTIANLVANEKICQAFLSEDIERHLNAHFDATESSDEVRQLAAMVLLRTTSISNDIISVEHLRNRVFRWMEQIVVMKEEELVRNCILTVHDLTCSPAIDARELDAPHVLRILVQVLHRHQQNADIVTLCLSVVYNLSCELALLHHLVQPDIMLFLRQQVPTSASFTLARRDSRIMTYLSKAEDKAQVSPSPLFASPSAQPSQKSAAERLCCLILHNLSCSAAAPDMAHRDAVLVELVQFQAPVLLHDLYFSSLDDLKETSAVALCNIAAGKVNSTRLLDDEAHKVLVDFIYTPHFQPSHMPLFSAVYRKLCCAPGNQTRLLNAGIAKAMVVMLSCPEIDLVSTQNLLATLSLLSKSARHLQQLADGGVLPCVVAIAEHSATSSELQAHCFDIISNLCTAQFDEDTSTSGQPEMNVISTLMKLSERHHSHHRRPNGLQQEQPPDIDCCFYARGDGQPLPLPELLTYLMKSPSTTTSLKKNLELKATYTVPARKWTSSAQPTPKDPPALECRELPLADPAQALPSSVKSQIAQMASLPHEPLVRTQAQFQQTESARISLKDRRTSSAQDDPRRGADGRPKEAEEGKQTRQTRIESLSLPTAPATAALTSRRLTKLQRGVSGRHILEREWSNGD